ncbi:M57 family metalloprotease [Chitinophaga solisilvae]|uniref:M57 family metalloprotease n=1 Tax=Chitinophaga solisilvae TaxID=1233460 RepID=UPI001369F169|nr:M57 family metalloprotease [Chitinophaga solisilvae]
MKIRFHVIAFMTLTVLILAACSKNTEIPVNPDSQSNADKVLAFIQGMGYSGSSIVDNGNAYIVAGDVRFPKNMQVPDTKIRTEQKWTGSILTRANSQNIRIKVDPSMTSMMAEIQSAVNNWNTAEAIWLHFVVVTSTSYDILIKDADLGTGICGQATFPSNGAAGNLVLINKAYIANHSFSQRQRTITHELGHTISLMHTNRPGGVRIPGTPPTDASSLMNEGQCNSGATVLSADDKKAVQWLY